MTKSESELTWKDLEIGAIVVEPGSASQYETGGWRSRSPVFDLSKCNKCGLCYIYCPDMAIDMETGEYPTVNLFYCKGCGICVTECPAKAITMVEEDE